MKNSKVYADNRNSDTDHVKNEKKLPSKTREPHRNKDKPEKNTQENSRKLYSH